jgi:cold shock CspA family protein
MIKREKGTVLHFNNAKGFGFIRIQPNGDIVYFSAEDIKDKIKLASRQQVDFTLSENENKLQAFDIVLLEKEAN